MALLYETIITDPSGTCTVTVLSDDVTGFPTSVTMQNTTGHAYRFYLGPVSERSLGFKHVIQRGRITRSLVLTIDTRVTADWMCGVEGI